MSKFQTILFYTTFMLTVIVLCAPKETETRSVIFYAPKRMEVFTGQILSSRAKDRPCPKCQMRNHRGQCRKIISFKSDDDC